MGKVAKTIWNALREGEVRKPTGWLTGYVTTLSLLTFAFEIYLNIMGTLEPYVHSMLFMSIMVALAFILRSPSKNTKGISWLDIALSISMVCLAIYIVSDRERLLTRLPLVDELTALDICFGFLTVTAILEITRRILGIGMILPVLGMLIYIFIGHWVQGSFYHRYIDWLTFLDQIIYTINGVAGVPMRVAATYVFIFVTLGAFLEKSGGGDFFYKLSMGIAGGQVGGPAKVAIVSSGAFGMISGSPTSDVATTGSFTIPLMIRMGYSRITAAAIETVAGTGGAVMPPVMGTAAFLMVEFTGIPYKDIIIGAAIPACLYYLTEFIQVHFHSQKLGILGIPKNQRPTVWDAFKDRGEFVIPLSLLVYLIISGLTPALAGIICLAITIPMSWIRKDSRMNLRQIINCIVTAVARLAPVVAACAAAGLFVGGLSITGLSSKFITLVNVFTAGIPLLAVVLSAFVLLVLGLGMPVPIVYVISASLVAPPLIELGMSIFQVHLFIVFYCALAAITPPEAAAAFTAAGIAEADPMKVGWQSCKYAIGGYLVPFIFIFNKGLLLQGTWLEIVYAIATATMGLFCLSVALEGYFRGTLTIVNRLSIAIGGLLFLVPWKSINMFGLVIGGIPIMYHLGRHRVATVVAKQKKSE